VVPVDARIRELQRVLEALADGDRPLDDGTPVVSVSPRFVALTVTREPWRTLSVGPGTDPL